MKLLLTGAFCCLTGLVFSQTPRCGNVTWETIERQLSAYQLSHPVIKKFEIDSFFLISIRRPVVPIPFRLPGYITCNNPPRTAYTLPSDVSKILKDHPVKTYNACVDNSILDFAKYVY